MNMDTDTLRWRDHGWILLAALLALAGLLGHVATQPAAVPDPARSRYHDASLDLQAAPVTTPQEYYQMSEGRDQKSVPEH